MKTTRRTLLAGGSAALIAGTVSRAASADDAKPKILVELFTSQGCSSCPPAESFLTELADRDDVVALEFHVDYWDYIGWEDPFADPAYTARQRRYNQLFGSPYNYTPQMVIDGRAHEVGSRRSAVEARIEAASMKRMMADRDAAPPTLTLSSDGTGGVVIDLDGKPPEAGRYDILIVGYDDMHRTEVTRGENNGRRLVNAHVVRSMKTVHTGWTGGAARIPVAAADIAGDGGCAVLVQDPTGGTIAALATMAAPGS